MRDCPKCGTVVDGNRCASCGYSEDGASASPALDPNRYLCVHTDRGLRCANLGTLTSNTRGPANGNGAHPGPWFCSDHFPPLGATERAREVRSELPLAHRTPLPRPVDFEDAIERTAIQTEQP